MKFQNQNGTTALSINICIKKVTINDALGLPFEAVRTNELAKCSSGDGNRQ